MTGDRFDVGFKDYFDATIRRSRLYPNGPTEFRARRASRALLDSQIIRRGDHQDLMMLGLRDELKDVAAVSRERITRELMRHFEPGMSTADVINAFGVTDWQGCTSMHRDRT